MSVARLRQGDEGITLSGTLRDANGERVDITGATLTGFMGPLAGGALVLDGASVNNDQAGAATQGDWSYAVAAADTATPGTFLFFIRATYGGGAVQGFPNGGEVVVVIRPDLADTAVDTFASVEEFEQRIGVELTADEHIRAQALIVRATGLIQRETKQTIFLVEGDQLTRPGSFNKRVRLPERPVLSVASVTLDGSAVAAGEWYLEHDELVRISWPSASQWQISGAWGNPAGTMVVTYSHGYADVPEEVRTVALEVVTRAWVNPGAVQQEVIGGVSTTFAFQPPGGMILTENERQVLARALRRTAGSVVLR